VNVQELADFDALIGQFYTVDSVAKVSGEILNTQRLNEKDLRIQKNTEGPQILIYHTHSQEGFADSVPGDASTTIVGAGEHLAEILRNQYGYNVLHHKGQYDVKTRDNAYSKALPEIQKVLEENPTIQVVIDLHRDGIDESAGKLVMDLDGRPTARFMFFNGVSCGKRTGNIDYLYNPNLEENLAFSFQLKKAAEEYYPGLARKNYINAYRYNMHLCGRTTLIELGAQNNTVEEIMNACYPIAHILDMVLGGA
jgi:stage II sporulation protein P